MTASKTLPLSDIIVLAQKSFDAGAKAELSFSMLTDALIAAGFTSANTEAFTAKAKREGKVSNENAAKRYDLQFLAVSTIKINGKRLSQVDVARAMDESVSNKALLSGTPKGTINGVTTWLGNASSYVGKLRKAIKAREEAAQDQEAGTPRAAKSDVDFIAERLQAAYGRTFKTDVAIKADLEEVQKAMREVAKLVGVTLKTPNK